MTAHPVAEGRCLDTDHAGAPQCALPGCRHGVDEPGRPCSCCRAAFGSMLQEIPPTADLDSPSAPADGAALAPAATTPLRGALPPLKMNSAVKAVISGTEERKQGQTCWLCTERRTCTKEEHGWECDKCRKIT